MTGPSPVGVQQRMAELVERVASDGDRGAFASLFGHFAPRLKSFYLRQGVNPDTADELIQECMLVLWNRAGRYDPGTAAVSTWLFTIARNLSVDRLRRERRYDPEPVPEDQLATEAHEGPEPELVAGERHERLRRALGTLPREQAEVLQMHYFQFRSSREIASLTGLPDGTVKSRMRLALARLRATLEES